MQEQQNNGIPTNPLCSWFYDTKNFNLGRFSVSNICPRIKKLDYINEILLIFLDRSCLIWNMKKIFGYLVGLNFVTFFFFLLPIIFHFFFWNYWWYRWFFCDINLPHQQYIISHSTIGAPSAGSHYSFQNSNAENEVGLTLSWRNAPCATWSH